MPNSRFNKALDLAQEVKTFLKPGSGDPHENSKSSLLRVVEYRRKLSIKRREAEQIRRKLRAATSGAERSEHKKNKKRVQQEIFQLQMNLGVAKRGSGDQETGALPDFLVIGAKKAGTTYLYRLLSQHPLVEPAASKEPHFFDVLYEEGEGWYRACFPVPRQKDGRTTITGEATPYMANRHSAQRAAGVAPEARLIALLRNPVDRAYSHYQQMVRRGGEKRTFEEAVETEMAASRLRDDPAEGGSAGTRPGPDRPRSSYLSRGVYVDQLARWAEHFDDDQMLVLKSEDFFGDPVRTLQAVLGFLGLPGWEPEPSEPRGKNSHERKKFKGKYKQEMAPETRRRLEEYFGPHNRRLYDYLGVDFGW